MRPECGTEKAYRRHLALGEKPDASCLLASSAARRDRRYGLAPGEYDSMYEAQGGRCFICGGSHAKGKLVVDHDHLTGEVRKLLCNHCNTLLGQALESVAILRNAVLYLEGSLQTGPAEFLAPERLKEAA